MVFAAEVASDFRKRRVCQFPAEKHGDLAREGNRALSSLGSQLRHFEPEVLCHDFLNTRDGNRALLLVVELLDSSFGLPGGGIAVGTYTGASCALVWLCAVPLAGSALSCVFSGVEFWRGGARAAARSARARTPRRGRLVARFSRSHDPRLVDLLSARPRSHCRDSSKNLRS